MRTFRCRKAPTASKGSVTDMPQRRKVQFYINEQEAADLDALVVEARLSSLSEVLRNALSFYRWAVREVNNGGKVQIVDAQGERSTVVFAGFGGGRKESGD